MGSHEVYRHQPHCDTDLTTDFVEDDLDINMEDDVESDVDSDMEIEQDQPFHHTFTYFDEPFIWHTVCCIAAGLSRCHDGLKVNMEDWKFEEDTNWKTVIHRDIKPDNSKSSNFLLIYFK
jgi:serine/threonine protein kinase